MNSVNLIGRMVADPELKIVGELSICNFLIAVPRKKKDETDFIRCVSFGKTGEIISENFLKGQRIAVSGSLRTNSYDGKDGTKKYSYDVVVEQFDFIEKKDKDTNEEVSYNGTPFNN